MARQKGMITIEGTIHGVNYYTRLGVPLARAAGGGFTTKSLKTSPNMAGIRRNGTEFGIAARTKGLIRRSVLRYLPRNLGTGWHSAFTSMLQEAKVLDIVSRHGSRSAAKGLCTAAGAGLLRDFVFTPEVPVFNLFDGLPVVSEDGGVCGFGGLGLTGAGFPAGATHVSLRYLVVDYDMELVDSVPFVTDAVVLAKDDVGAELGDFVLGGLPPIGSFRVGYLVVHFCAFSEAGVLAELRGDGMKGLRALSCGL